jgi:hypothetical protein
MEIPKIVNASTAIARKQENVAREGVKKIINSLKKAIFPK